MLQKSDFIARSLFVVLALLAVLSIQVARGAEGAPAGATLAPVETVDLASLGGDAAATPYDHNGSRVLVLPHRGLIVYAAPKPGIRDVVKPGTVLFRGTPWAPGAAEAVIVGDAFSFKKGCAAARYPVRGAYDAEGGMQQFRLEGAAPTRSRTSCDLTGVSAEGANARLTFTGAWE